jgi:D-xylose transport system substrate-binding protein
MFKKKAKGFAALSVVGVLALTLSACGDDGGDGDGGDGGDGGGDAADAKVGVILPDTTSSPRWEANDRPSLEAAFEDAGVEYKIENADGDTGKFGTICDSMINEGVTVLMIVNLDSDSGSACLSKAEEAGIPSIDYDRLTLGGGAEYYVSFDNVVVGQLMGEGLISCLDDMGKTKANIVMIDGDPTDNNAALFKEGYVGALQEKVDSGDYTVVGEQTGEWDATKAGTAFEQIFTENDGDVDGVVSANDTMAGGIIARLEPNGLAGKVPVTGQDASVEGLQRILAGSQCMTVYKNTALEADAASQLAIALATNDQEAADALATGEVEDTELGEMVPSVLATPEAIFKDGVKQVIDDGFQQAADVCTGEYAKFCQEAGIS